MSKYQLKLCEKLYDKADDSTYHKVKMMAFLFKGKTLISTGINSDKTDPIQSQFRQMILGKNYDFIDKRHAEVDCLKYILNHKDLNPKDLTLWIISKRKNGTFRNSKPCVVCKKMIDILKVGEICYIFNNRVISEKLF